MQTTLAEVLGAPALEGNLHKVVGWVGGKGRWAVGSGRGRPFIQMFPDSFLETHECHQNVTVSFWGLKRTESRSWVKF